MVKPVYIVVTPFFPSPENWRGAYCYDFVVALKKTGRYRVEVFIPGVGDDYTIGGIEVHRFPIRQLPSNIFPLLFSGWNQRSFLQAIEKAEIDITDIAICHAHTANFSIYPVAIKRLCKNCIGLLHHHDPSSFGLNVGVLRHFWLYNLLMFPILRRVEERVDVHVFISSLVKCSYLQAPNAKWSIYDDYLKQMKGLPYRKPKIKKWVVLHNGVDMSIFMRAPKRKSNDVFTIGSIGNYLDWKDQITLLRAVEMINSWGVRSEGVKECGSEGVRVVFVGSGPERAKCEAYAREKGIDAEFRNEVRHEALTEFYRSIDLFVLPSYFEGFGCVFTESWACGTPFITCEGQGMDDMIPADERKLWLCKPRHPEDLADKIKNYIKNRPVQHLAGEIDIDKLVPEFVEKIEELRKE